MATTASSPTTSAVETLAQSLRGELLRPDDRDMTSRVVSTTR